jgi:hypothetical protein
MSDKSAIFHELKPSVGEITKHCNILLNHCKDVEEEGALIDHEIFQNFSFQLEKTKDYLIDAITGCVFFFSAGFTLIII